MTVIPLKKRVTNKNKGDSDTMVLRKKKIELKKRVRCDNQSDLDIIAAPKKIRAQTLAAVKEITNTLQAIYWMSKLIYLLCMSKTWE